MIHKNDDAFDATVPALIVTFGNTAKRHRTLHRQVTVLGKARGCDIGLVAPDVSDVHCVILRTGGGLHIRDCASRSGTRLNGEEIAEAMLHDGAILQIGPFSFRVYLPSSPASANKSSQTPERISRLERSRKNLGRIAWTFRSRLRASLLGTEDGTATGLPFTNQAELDRQAATLREQIRAYEQRLRQLEQAERDLACDRDTLDQEFAALQDRILQTEQELVRREAEVETAIRARWEQFQQQFQSAQAQLREPAAETGPLPADDLVPCREHRPGQGEHFSRHLKPPHGGSGIRRVPG
jgi:pSer/pThr/pTyr-binding forkhead associated (FHA) protein